ncbi:methyltransferase domain-containing protein [Bizionia gelidisalsuginis]|uniref:Methyltransferase domain-containing protein n=1 Tax=Bizionia gelidisalsuginis TaxID=291188 RepID=A0ABY3MDX0_9FLAO|nr:methyltransferase domain-containing protein [Bizionia gelidisalsuginis]TYC17811.1 methyltransferase domain-containing protein [Bizionia gelidisalsuginis]
MIFKNLKSHIDVDDPLFNTLYPLRVKKLSDRHWTSVEVAKLAAEYLVDKPNCKVLDIGSGAGKFCLIGAASTKGLFYGVEQREGLVKLSRRIAEKNKINTTAFIHSNITQISFSDYDAFYFYNPFYENIDNSHLIDSKIATSKKLYIKYSDYVQNQLKKTPIGTRLVTYWSTWEEIPLGFDLEFTGYNGKLNFWEKKF